MYSRIIHINHQDLYPYIEIALQTFLSCSISIFSVEIFVFLKKSQVSIENKEYQRQNSLAVLIVTSDLTNKSDYDIIDVFSNANSRCKYF